MERHLPPEKTRGCCCLGFGAESKKLKQMQPMWVGGGEMPGGIQILENPGIT